MVNLLINRIITNKVVVCTNTIQAGQSINDNVLQVFRQTPLDNYSSVEQFIVRNRSYNSIRHLFLSVGCHVNKVLNNNLRNRYYNRFQDTRIKAWSNMNINIWIKVLSKHEEIILSDTLLNKLNNPDYYKCINISQNELYNNNLYNGKQFDIKFKGKKELYNFYGVKIFPHHYEIAMRKNVVDDGKRARM